MDYDPGAQDAGLRTDKVVAETALITHLNHPSVESRNKRKIDSACQLICKSRVGERATVRSSSGPNSHQKFSIGLTRKCLTENNTRGPARSELMWKLLPQQAQPVRKSLAHRGLEPRAQPSTVEMPPAVAPCILVRASLTIRSMIGYSA